MADPARAFVAGHPIGHSRSPLIHRFWLDRLGLAGSYEPLDIAPDDFPFFLAGLSASDWAGGNVTIPHKQTAFAAIDKRDAAAEAIGAVNTIWKERGELAAGNTDAYGFAANLDDWTPQWRAGQRALVIGAGGASRAILHALLQAGYRHIDLANRTRDRAAELADLFGESIHAAPLAAIDERAADADLVVNTTSLGMSGEPPLMLDLDKVGDQAIVTDIVYAPLVTPMLAAARDRGLTVADGLGMLLHQAVPGFERWFGVRPLVTPDLRAHIVADLEAHCAGDNAS
ncbi:MAG: shikimate dehydrogenase [Roseitalea sp.]|uniref:shikimate dehydrogenase n=1 Tax=Oceaniradius stylonematis TaxID=2184161 RepID=UPI001B0C6EC1|nr:shikimate dehydrogenase [Roseitalea sp.]MBO6952914.1 shikimate dehydrogenase [Rhizobiaceae bacterium]MBO6593261.1 shikimate dehydrogenase [Roseitalea sp.]MBO6600749.1 shikimate dehydrogenase [Roseitalea sp.]MBO6612430.1 shikimate dehydrogenase [Roseitalea sp.]